MAVCGIVFLAFLLLAVTDSQSGRQKKRGNGRGIQELLLLDEKGNEISAWHIGGKRPAQSDGTKHKKTWTLIFRIQVWRNGRPSARRVKLCGGAVVY